MTPTTPTDNNIETLRRSFPWISLPLLNLAHLLTQACTALGHGYGKRKDDEEKLFSRESFK